MSRSQRNRSNPPFLRLALLALLLLATAAVGIWVAFKPQPRQFDPDPPAARASAAPSLPLAPRKPLVLATMLEGTNLCDEAAQDPNFKLLVHALESCKLRGLDGATTVENLLNQLEPGGADGQVQVGFTASLQLLGLYKRQSEGSGWEIDESRVDEVLRVIEKVERPVVIYFMGGHFDSTGPITEELLKDPRNVMHFADGTVPELGYFGYKIAPYTLLADPDLPINRLRFDALRHYIKRINALPEKVKSRIIAYTLMGEVHQLFPDFENGVGRYDDIKVTDYSAPSVARFREWLEEKYGSLQSFNEKNGFSYASFDAVPAPSKDIRKEKLDTFGQHYDAFAHGTMPFSGWLWDPKRQVAKLDLYVDGARIGPVPRGLNRLDVYRALEAVDDPNVGYRIDYEFSALKAGRHVAQLVAEAPNAKRFQLARAEFSVAARGQASAPARSPREVSGLAKADALLNGLAGVRTYLDLPKANQDIYFNPLARDWNQFRAWQVEQFLAMTYQVALDAGLPADKIYSHQIVPDVNSTWNPQLFAVGKTLARGVPWKSGVNMYGGAVDSAWLRNFMAERGITDYGAPEFNPQQWKLGGGALAALRSHYDAGARFVSPYYFSLIPDRFKTEVTANGVNNMELGPNNTRDGSNLFYRSIIEFARQ